MTRGMRTGPPGILSLVVMLVLMLSACGGAAAPTVAPNTSAAAAQPSPTSTTAPTATPKRQPAATTASTAAPTSTLSPTDTPVPTAAPTPAPTATPRPDPTPTAAPAVSAAPTVAPTVPPAPVPQTVAFDGVFVLWVEQPHGENFSGKEVSFKLEGFDAAEDATWTQGAVDQLDLTASSTAGNGYGRLPGVKSVAPDSWPRSGGVLSSPLRQPQPPHVFVGTATIDGVLALEGTVVTAWIDGEMVPGAQALVVARHPAATEGDPVGQALQPLGEILVRVWKFDPASQAWSFYDPRPALSAYSTIDKISKGDFLQMILTAGQTVTLNNAERTLYQGVNFVFW